LHLGHFHAALISEFASLTSAAGCTHHGTVTGRDNPEPETDFSYFSGTGNSLFVAKEMAKRVPGSRLRPIIASHPYAAMKDIAAQKSADEATE
jgi:hypothetical protein